ncbi:MAG: phenylacetate--CoA ligase family protein [Chitinophagaceae bacterium]|nr:phenylacetate--CoA ligase family protein [Chitinophagaceae bacterium]
MNKDAIYSNSPYFIKRLLVNFQGYKNAKGRYGKLFDSYFELFKSLWTKSGEELEEYRSGELKKLLLECYRYSEWYKKKFEALSVSEADINDDPFKVLYQLPLLEKQERRQFAESIRNNNPGRPTVAVGFTSGTSGSPTINYLDKESVNLSFALWKRFHWAIGLPLNPRTARFSGRIIVHPKAAKPPFWVYNYFEKQIYFSTYHLTEQNMGSYVKKLNSFKPVLIDGYPSAIYVLAEFINKNKLSLNFKPTAIATTAETLHDYQRASMEKAFGCKVYNQYASSEGGAFITECKEGKLHVNTDTGIFEFLNLNNEPAAPGEIAQLVMTSFRNFKTPLLRYRIGDTVLLPEKQISCNCGCKMPIIEKITGREDDILWTKQKGYVGRMDTAYKGLEGIVKSQLIQESPDSLIVNNVVDEKYSTEYETKLIANLKNRLGDDIRITINLMNDIPLSANGKFTAVKRKFKIDSLLKDNA